MVDSFEDGVDDHVPKRAHGEPGRRKGPTLPRGSVPIDKRLLHVSAEVAAVGTAIRVQNQPVEASHRHQIPSRPLMRSIARADSTNLAMRVASAAATLRPRGVMA